jgi:hypothetical protein
MRTTSGLIAVAVLAGVIAGCDGSATSPARCDSRTTTAAFVAGDSLSGVVTSLRFLDGSTEAGTAEIAAVEMNGDPNFVISFVVGDQTAVFVRAGNGTPQPTNGCHLAVGQRVELPYSYFTSGFGDYVDESQAGSQAPLPPTIGQIVIAR